MRNTLPFREKTELFLINEYGNVLAEDHQTYIMFPGWGIDEEDKITSAIRELQEETGYEIVWDLLPLCTVSWIWFPEWANNPKRLQRYQEYQGEKVYMYIGKTKKIAHTLLGAAEEDCWTYTDGMKPNECLDVFAQYAQKDHINTYVYRVAQYAAIRAACIYAGIDISCSSSHNLLSPWNKL